MSAVRIFTPEYYRALHNIERRHPWARAMRRLEIALLERYLPEGPARSFDAGCGAGLFLAELTALRPGVEPYGGDLSRHALRLAMQTGHRGLAELDVRRLPVCDGSFDLVISNDVLQHLGREGASQALHEAWRILRPGGLLLVRTAARRGPPWRRHRDTVDYCQWTRGEFRRLLEECGFQPRFMARVNWAPSLLAELTGLFGPRREGDAGMELQPDEAPWKERLLELYWRWERRLLRAGLRLPCGHNLAAAVSKAEAASGSGHAL